MKVLFAVSNENTSQAIVKKYQSEYKQIISYKNVYYFNAILKELQRDKTYDRVVISEDLEQYVNSDYEQMDRFLFDRLDSISDEASNINGEDIPIILICTERRNKSEQILVKLFGIGIYNALIGNDRSATEVCRLINRPRSKKDAKVYYKIDAEDVTYGKENENDVSELEIQNILSHYKKIGNDEEKCVESFDSIAEQYNETQLRVISKCLPLKVRAILEEKSTKYQEINSYSNKIADRVRIEKSEEKTGTSEILLKGSKEKKIGKPVVIPSAIDATKKKKILSNAVKSVNIKDENLIEKSKEEEKNIVQDVVVEEIPKIKEIPLEEIVIETEEDNDVEELTTIENISTEIIENDIQPVKRGRGRPRKNVSELEQQKEQTVKRGRGRPKKVVEPEIKEEKEGVTPLNFNDKSDGEHDIILPGFDDESDDGNDTILPGFSDESDNDDTILPGFCDESDEDDTILSSFSDESDDDDTILPGFDDKSEDEDAILPGFDNESDNQEIENDIKLLKFDNQENSTQISKSPIISDYDSKINNEIKNIQREPYIELDMNSIMNPGQKLVAFVGTSKNGTSFLINNVAEILSMNGINTAILDLTRNRNSYYIYTKNDEQLRNQSNYITNNLKVGTTNGILEHKNLTIYTSPIEGDENLEAVEPIVETLVQNHTVVLMDCDFMTPMRYFKYAQEIYLVQSMDTLTIQPLTAFLRQLTDKGMFEGRKARVVLNKFIKTKEINESLLIGGMSIYNDPGMTVRKELFDRRTVQSIAIPFDQKSYLRYLDGLVTCDISLKGYSKEFVQCLKKLASMIYEGHGTKKSGKYVPPSVKNNSGFSPRVNNTLNQMKQNY